MSVRYSKHLPLFVYTIDIVLLNISLVSAHFLVFHHFFTERPSEMFFVLANVIWAILTQTTKCYEIRRPLVLRDNFNKFLLTIIYHLLILFASIYFFRISDISRLEVVFCYSLFATFVFIQRSVLFFSLDLYRKKGYNHRDILFIGSQTVANQLEKSFHNHPEYGYDLIGLITEEEIFLLSEEELKSKILNQQPDEIFVCYEQINAQLIQQMIKLGDDYNIKINVVPGIAFGSNGNKATLMNYDNIPVLRLNSGYEIPFKIRVLKRSFDLVFSVITMLLGFPIFVILYILTKVTSEGPAFYRQERIGRDNKPFYIYKFRSMYVNSELAGPQLSKDFDSRITKWGLFMRKTRLDELPQFWNVFKGDMSVVGPRPERQFYIEKIIEKTPNYKRLSTLKPGLTSVGQVHYGYAENVDEMCERVRYDLIYLKNLTLNSDLDLIFRTVKVMVQKKGK